MKGKNRIIRLLTIISSVILIVSMFGATGTIALAEEGDEDGDTVYYDVDGNVLTDPYDASECFSENGTPIPCPDDPEDDDADDEKQIPPGQLTRGGLSGPIVEVGDGYVVVETNFGLVKVYTDEEVDESMIGQRVAVKLDTTGTEDTDNGTDYYRIATADQFKLVPTQVRNRHRWGIIESTEEGCFFVDDDGNEIPVECGEGEADVVGLFGGSGNGTGGANQNDSQPVLLGTEGTGKITARIQRRLELAEKEGDEKVINRLRQQLEKHEEKELERQERKTERAQIRAEKIQAKGKPEKDDKSTANNE